MGCGNLFFVKEWETGSRNEEERKGAGGRNKGMGRERRERKRRKGINQGLD